jgi:hypothetical protein
MCEPARDSLPFMSPIPEADARGGQQDCPTEEERSMRRWTILVGLAALIMALSVVPAAADSPATFEGQTVFMAPNVCDEGNLHEVTISYTLTVHEHSNATVLRFTSWGSTDSGFEGPGHETSVETENGTWTATTTFIQRNPETGEVYTVKYRGTYANGEMRVDTFGEARCTRDV